MVDNMDRDDVVTSALVHLWTRIGEEETEEHNSNVGGNNWEYETPSPSGQHFGFLRVERYELASAPSTRICGRKLFIVDPIGVTNFDLLSRALDLCACALRNTLIQAVEQALEQPSNTNPAVRAFIKAIYAYKDQQLVPQALSEGSGVQVFHKTGERIALLRAFAGCDIMTLAHVKGFVGSHAMWADLRSVLVFLSKACPQVLRQCSYLIEMRDRVKHQHNLVHPTQQT